MSLQDWPLVTFWIVLAVCFGYLSWHTRSLRNKFVPEQFNKVEASGSPYAGYGWIVKPLESVFNQMLLVEEGAFILSILAAIVEAAFLFFK